MLDEVVCMIEEGRLIAPAQFRTDRHRSKRRGGCEAQDEGDRHGPADAEVRPRPSEPRDEEPDSVRTEHERDEDALVQIQRLVGKVDEAHAPVLLPPRSRDASLGAQRSTEKSFWTRRRPAAPSRARSRGSRASATRCSTHWSAPRAMSPLSSCPITRALTPTSSATTGMPAAMYCRALYEHLP